MATQDEGGNIQIRPAEQSPKLMTGSEIYESFFGLDRLYPNELGESLDRYGFLAAKPNRSDSEEMVMCELLSELREAGIEPAWEPVARSREDG